MVNNNIWNINDQCVLFLLDHIKGKKTFREKRIYRALNKKYDINSNYNRLLDLLWQQRYIDVKLPDNPMEDQSEAPPVTNNIGRTAIRDGVFVSETGVYYGRLWCLAFKIIYKALFKSLIQQH